MMTEYDVGFLGCPNQLPTFLNRDQQLKVSGDFWFYFARSIANLDGSQLPWPKLSLL